MCSSRVKLHVVFYHLEVFPKISLPSQHNLGTYLTKYAYVCGCLLSCVWLFMALWTVVHQVPLSMEFSRQEYGSRLLFPILGELPNLGIEPTSLVSPAVTGEFLPLAPPRSQALKNLIALFSSWVIKYNTQKKKGKLSQSEQYLD